MKKPTQMNRKTLKMRAFEYGIKVRLFESKKSIRKRLTALFER